MKLKRTVEVFVQRLETDGGPAFVYRFRIGQPVGGKAAVVRAHLRAINLVLAAREAHTVGEKCRVARVGVRCRYGLFEESQA